MSQRDEYLAAAQRRDAEASRLEAKGGPVRMKRAAEARESARLYRWQAAQLDNHEKSK